MTTNPASTHPPLGEAAEAAAPAAFAVPESDWNAAVNLLSGASEAYLVCHVSPDGDALGSALAAGLGLRAIGIRTHVSVGEDPLVVPCSLDFLPGQELLIPAAAVPTAPELMVAFDAPSFDRLGLLKDNAQAARNLLIVDHHRSNAGFGTCRVVDPAAPAAAVLVDELLRRLDIPVTQPIATCLYTGVASDTGSFKYPSTTEATHQLAARLLATGVNPDRIARRLWDTASFSYLKVLAAALDRAALEPAAAGGLGLVWTVVPRADRQRNAVGLDEVEGLIDIVRRTAEAEVTLVLKEDDHGVLQVSCRARGAINLAPVCEALGGGGHALASGFTSRDGVPTTVRRFRELLDAAASTQPPLQPAPVPNPREGT